MSLLVPALVGALFGAPADLSATKVSDQRDGAAVPIGEHGWQDRNRIVCRKTLVLGAIRPKKVCLTAFDWAAREDAAQRTMDSTLYGQGAIKPPMVNKP